MNKIFNVKTIVPILATIVLLMIPAPEGLKANAWQFFALFVGVILGLIFEPIPSAAVGFIGISIGAVFRLVKAPDVEVLTPAASVNWALSGFSNSIVWLIFAAFMFSHGYKKTGLGKRVALLMIKYMGKNTLGLGYAISIADLILAPFTPSNAARSGGTIYPIVSNIPPMFNSYPDKNPKAIGSYLTWVGIASGCVTSSMFLTSLAPTALAAGILSSKFNIELDWMKWFLTVGLITIPMFLLTPIITYFIYPPTVKKSPEVAIWASEELKKIGKLSFKEVLLFIFVILALFLWIFGEHMLKINPTTTAMLVVSLMLVFDILNWNDILENKSAWNVFIWFATLVAMASGLNTVGFLSFLSKSFSSSLSGLSPDLAIVSLTLIFIFIHYFFASGTAHVTALLPIFMTLGLAIIPHELGYKLAMMLTGSLGIMGIITPYGTGHTPIWYGSGFISQKTWWILGFEFLAIYLIIYIPLGMLMIN